jgi:hypothetical protein
VAAHRETLTLRRPGRVQPAHRGSDRLQYDSSYPTITIVTGLVGAVLELGFTIYYQASGYPAQAVLLNAAAVILSLAGLVCIRFLGSPRPAAHLIILGAYTALVGPGVFTGGIDSSAIVWLIFIPFIAALTAGAGASLVWSGVTMLSLITLFVANRVLMIDYTVKPSGSTERLIDLGCAIAAMVVAIGANETIKKRMVARLGVEIAERTRSQAELRSRNEELEQLNARLLETTARLEESNSGLERALADVRQLSGMLPICASCKKIRNDKGYWEAIDAYLRDHSDVEFTHGICPECVETLYPDVPPHD